MKFQPRPQYYFVLRIQFQPVPQYYFVLRVKFQPLPQYYFVLRIQFQPPEITFGAPLPEMTLRRAAGRAGGTEIFNVFRK